MNSNSSANYFIASTAKPQESAILYLPPGATTDDLVWATGEAASYGVELELPAVSIDFLFLLKATQLKDVYYEKSEPDFSALSMYKQALSRATRDRSIRIVFLALRKHRSRIPGRRSVFDFLQADGVTIVGRDFVIRADDPTKIRHYRFNRISTVYRVAPRHICLHGKVSYRQKKTE